MNNKKALTFKILLNKLAVLLAIFAFLGSYFNLETNSTNFSKESFQSHKSDFSFQDVVKRTIDHQNDGSDESDKPEPYSGEKESSEGEDSEDNEENEKRERERENDALTHCFLDVFSLSSFSFSSSFYTVYFYRETLSIPYYILFHNWKHFLS